MGRRLDSGLPPAAELAGTDGLLAVALPATKAVWNGHGSVPFPRAATNGIVQIRHSSDATLDTSFRVRGVVRGLALTPDHLVAAVEGPAGGHIEWFDTQTGRRQGEIAANVATEGWRRGLAADGSRVVFATSTENGPSTLWLLDLSSGQRTMLARRQATVFDLSLDGSQLVWAELGAKQSAVVSLTVNG
jgi:hypothetical protein